MYVRLCIVCKGIEKYLCIILCIIDIYNVFIYFFFSVTKDDKLIDL